MPTDKLLRILLPLYIAASLLHFSHNAEHLDSYPNLPPWITRANIYFIWLGMTAAGCLGFLLYGKRRSPYGLVVLGLYAVAGLGGLLHYTRAPFSAHTATMNFSILLEASIAAALLAVTAVTGCHRGSSECNVADEPDE
jgi:hypothetical protein